MSKFKDGPIGPTVILLAICLVITFALAGVYNVTAPVIETGKIAEANEARKNVLPAGDTFTQVPDASLPEGVTEVYKADNGAGYVFTTGARGFGGPVVYMVGLDSSGETTGIHMLSHKETPGLGTKVQDQAYLEQYYGGRDPEAVDAVSGATRTTNSLKKALAQAQEAYQMLQ